MSRTVKETGITPLIFHIFLSIKYNVINKTVILFRLPRGKSDLELIFRKKIKFQGIFQKE